MLAERLGSREFLRAEWRHIAFLNYEIHPEVLRPYVPAGTTLDLWHGKAIVSLVGFLFLDTRVLGCPVPFHRSFEEVNLRLYVRREVAGEVRRGVAFIREIVPRQAVAAIARWLYNEKYIALPMQHQIARPRPGELSVSYSWRLNGHLNEMQVNAREQLTDFGEGSAEEFILEHYWGYTHRRGRGSTEYQVAHPRWRVWPVTSSRCDIDVKALYGEKFVAALSREPVSAMLAEGSAVRVYGGQRCQ